MREEQEREESVGRGRQAKNKGIRKKEAGHDLTHYFSKMQRQPAVNRNIPTPDKAAIEQIDQAFAALHQQEHLLLQHIQDAKMRAERQKEEREYYLSKSRAIVAQELKRTAHMRRFFRRQDRLTLKDKQHLLSTTEQEVRLKKQALQADNVTAFQSYFLHRDLESAEREVRRLWLEVGELAERCRIAQEEQRCYFAKEGWPLLLKRYQVVELVGKGGFSEVYRAYDLFRNQQVAIKLSSVEHLLQGCGNKAEYLRHIKRELDIHKQLNHPNIVTLLEVIEIDAAFCIVLEFCEGCTLAQYLRASGPLGEAEARMIVQQIAQVIHYLSSQQPVIIHYDLKPQNIIFSRGQLKVLDFGICKTMDSEHSKMALTSQGIGTSGYLPPETLIPNNPVISNKVDVWSLGVIFYELLRGKRPFGHSSAAVAGGMEELFSGMSIGSECREFILGCLEVREAARLNPLEILSHPYMVGPA